jgi:hypothetical protein
MAAHHRILLFEWVPSTKKDEENIPECDWLQITSLKREPNNGPFQEKVIRINQKNVHELLKVIHDRIK